ncbi:hypothetical protein GCM10009562_26960 [Nocardioides aquaticus]
MLRAVVAIRILLRRIRDSLMRFAHPSGHRHHPAPSGWSAAANGGVCPVRGGVGAGGTTGETPGMVPHGGVLA